MDVPITVHTTTSGTGWLRWGNWWRWRNRSFHSFDLCPNNLGLSHHVGGAFGGDALCVISR